MGLAYWAYDFQALLAGLLAAVAAFATIAVIRKQIKQFEEHRLDDITRLNWGDRANAVKATSEISVYADEIINYAWFARKRWVKNPAQKVELGSGCPKYPYESFDRVSALVKTAAPDDARKIAEFLTFAQIADSRLKSFEQSLVETGLILSENSFFSIMFEGLIVHEFAMRLLPYVRDPRNGVIANFPIKPSVGPTFSLDNAIFDADWKRFLVGQDWPPSYERLLKQYFSATKAD